MDENISSTRGMIHFDWDPAPELPEPEKRKAGRHVSGTKNIFWRKYLILIIGAAAFTIWSILLASWVNYRAGKEAQAVTQSAVRSAVTSTENHIFDVLGITREQFQEMEKAKEEGKEKIITGQESWEAYVQREIDAVAAVISKLSTDQQKYTEAACMLARVRNPSYPGTFEAVAKQKGQWMFYDGTDNSFDDHDQEIAESIVRPWLESERYPTGLTAEMVYASWSPNDYVLRDDYEGNGTMHTWRWQG